MGGHKLVTNDKPLPETMMNQFTDIIWLNILRLSQNGPHFPDDILKCIFLTENVWISIKISLRFVPRSPINNISVLVQIVASCRPGDNAIIWTNDG